MYNCRPDFKDAINYYALTDFVLLNHSRKEKTAQFWHFQELISDALKIKIYHDVWNKNQNKAAEFNWQQFFFQALLLGFWVNLKRDSRNCIVIGQIDHTPGVNFINFEIVFLFHWKSFEVCLTEVILCLDKAMHT